MPSVARNAAGVKPAAFPGAIIAGFDVHLRQITFDCLDAQTGEVTRGRICSEPAAVKDWVAQFCGREVHVAMEACTGWLFVAQAVPAGGGIAHLAETVETRALRGRKRRAKTDRQDALWLRELLAEGRLDRPRARAPMALAAASAQGVDRRAHPMAAQNPLGPVSPRDQRRRAAPDRCRGRPSVLSASTCPRDARERITVALFMIDTLERQIHQSERWAASHRAPSAWLLSADGPVRGRRADRPDVPVRAW